MVELKKICKKCEVELGLEHFGMSHKGKLGKQAKCYRCLRDEWYQRRYGVGVEWFEERLKKQKNRCGVCKTRFIFTPFIPPFFHSTRAVLDCDRMTHEPRGVLCVRCATLVGILDDDRDLGRRVMAYIRD